MSHKKEFQEFVKAKGYIVLQELDGCPLKAGDFVTFTNDYGVEFHHREVLGIASPEYTEEYFPSCKEIRVFIDSTAYWFPKRLSLLTKE